MRHIAENRNYVMKVIKLKGVPAKEREACLRCVVRWNLRRRRRERRRRRAPPRRLPRRSEVNLMRRLCHPNIVAFKDSFVSGGGADESLCIVMTFCDGGDLAARLVAARGALFKEDLILHWFVQLALAVHFMHDSKVLHRDIKAANIFLLGSGRVVLGDLGISKVLDGGAGALARTQIGTPYYMSPELFKAAAYGYKSDVWAVGCVLYELAALAHPFDAASLPALSSRVAAGRYPPIHARYSASLHKLIASMLALNPAARPSMCVAGCARRRRAALRWRWRRIGRYTKQ